MISPPVHIESNLALPLLAEKKVRGASSFTPPFTVRIGVNDSVHSLFPPDSIYLTFATFPIFGFQVSRKRMTVFSKVQ